MKLVSYLLEERDRLGVLINNTVYDMEVLHPDLPNSMGMFLNYWEDAFPVAQAGELMLREGSRTSKQGMAVNDVQLLAPVPFPTSCRDGYAFRQHVAAARRNRRAEMIAEFDQYPVFYFTNPHSIMEIIERASYGVDLYPGDVIGSGTVGTGCFLELNGTAKLKDPDFPEQWLVAGDVVEMEIDSLGKLTNTIVTEETGWSILKRKKIG